MGEHARGRALGAHGGHGGRVPRARRATAGRAHARGVRVPAGGRQCASLGPVDGWLEAGGRDIRLGS